MKLVIVSIFSKNENPIAKKFGESIIHHFQNARKLNEIVVITNSDFPVSLSEKNLKIIPDHTFDGLKNSLKVLKIIRREKPDAIYFNIDFLDQNIKTGIYFFKFLIPIFFSFKKVPSILFLNNYREELDLNHAKFSGDYFNAKGFKIKKYILFKILPKVNLVSLPNSKDFNSFHKNYPNYPLKHSPYVRTVRSSLPNFLNDENDLLKINTYLGNKPHQELTFLVQALSNSKNINIEIALSTNPDTFVLENFISENNIPPTIKIVNYFSINYFEFIKNGKMVLFLNPLALKDKDLLLNVSLLGKPILAPNEKNASIQMREEGYSAHYYTPRNENSLYRGIFTVYNSKSYGFKLAKKNYSIASQNTLDTITSYYIDLYTNYNNKKKTTSLNNSKV